MGYLLSINLNVDNYNFYFEACAFIFLIILCLKHFTKKCFPNKIITLYNWSLVCALIDIICNVCGSIIINYFINETPLWLNYIVNGIFYIIQISIPSFLFTYVLLLLGDDFSKKHKHYLLFIPCALFVIISLINPLLKDFGIFYLLKDAEGNVSYQHGKIFVFYYATAIFYFLLTYVYTIFARRSLRKKEIVTIHTSLFFIISGIVIQIWYPSILLTGITITSSLYFIGDNIANPDDLVDKISGTYNFNALSLYFEKKNKTKKSFITVNIESLSPVNETFGVVIGNKIYKRIGTFLNSLDRKGLTFRIFSSKFVLPYDDKDLMASDAKKIKEKFETAWDVDGKKFFLSCDIIFFTLSKDVNDCDGFLNFTSIIDSEAKKQKNNFLFVDDDYIKRINREILIEKALSDAFSNDCKGFYMCYQPIYNCKTKKYDRAEALLRFKDEMLGQLSPGEFIPIAEKAGYAEKLDEYVLTTVSNFLKKHLELNVIHVNISGAEFFHNPAKSFIEIINKANIDSNRICFEITETASIKYPQNISHFMDEMIKLNTDFAIDDFGTGYSNVYELFKKPFKIIKIDRTLLDEAEKIRLFLKSISSLFKELKYIIVLEGVETKEQLDLADSLNIDYIQGFYFSRPLSEDDFIQFINKNN